MRIPITRILATAAAAVVFNSPSANAVVRTANFIEHNLSLNLGYGVTSDGYRDYFSTYDGIHTWALFQPGVGYSGEARPDNASSTTYRTDFDVYDTLFAVFAGYGSLTVSMPSTDANADGLPDFLDLNRSGNASFSGTGLEFLSGVGNGSFTVSGSLARSVGSYLGSYSVATSGGSIVTGTFAISGITGTVTYDTATRNMSVSGLSFGGSTSVTGTITYDVLDQNTIRINSFVVIYSGGSLSTVGSFNLARSGNKYFGKGALSDGNPSTAWVDFNMFHLTVTDTNDSDGDGIPDLSDPPAPPTINVQPTNQVVIVGESVTLSVAATGTPPLSFQWLKNGGIISAATGSSYTINNVQTNAVGSYSVVVTNIAGRLTSSNAVLAIMPPPVLTVLRQGANFVLSWPTNWPGFTLQSTTNVVVSPVWVSNAPPPLISSGNYVVTNSITGKQKLYRLKK